MMDEKTIDELANETRIGLRNQIFGEPQNYRLEITKPL
jgi:hypothetical protein